MLKICILINIFLIFTFLLFSSQLDEIPLSNSPLLNNTDIIQNKKRLQKLFEGLEYKYNEDTSKQNINRSIKIFQELSEEKDTIGSQALYELGDTYFYGTQGFRGIKRDPKKALNYYNTSALSGFGPALHMMSFAVATGYDDIVPPNESKATRLEHFASLTDYLPSIIGMGFRFLIGNGIQKNCETALQYYKFAAQMTLSGEFGNIFPPLSDFDRLGEKTFDMADDLERFNDQKEEITKYWENEAKDGDPLAAYELAKLLSDNPKNEKQVNELYNKAAKKDFAPALRDLGASHFKANATKDEIQKGISYFQQAAELGDAEAQNFLGFLNLFGEVTSFPVQQNITLAKYYLQKAALQDFPESLYLMGELQLQSYKNDTNILKNSDYLLAIRFYERAADYGYVHAFWKLGQLYDLGKGINRSCEAATHAFKYVAETGPWIKPLREAMTSFVNRDYENALSVYSLFAEEGYEVAQMNSVWLYKNKKGYYGKHYLNKALRLLYLSYLQGNPKALYEISDIYLNGRGDVPKSVETAIQSLKLSLQKGDLRSLPILASLFEKGVSTVPRDYDKSDMLLNYELDQLWGIDPMSTESSNTLLSKPTLKDNIKKMSKISFIMAQKARLHLKRKLSWNKETEI